MSINDFVEMTIFLCLICFSIYAKMQSFLDEWFFCVCVFYTSENDFGEKSPVVSADTLSDKDLVEIALSHTVSKINVILRFTQKFKMATKIF